MPLGRASQSCADRWYLAQLKPGGFQRAVTNLARQGYESFMPLRKQTFRRSGRWDTSLRPLFPGYLFIKVPDDRRQWRSINATYGVSRLVALEAGHPTPVDPDIVTALQARVGEHGELQPTAELEVGDHVRVLSGPLANKLAEIEVISEQNRIYVLLELMGHYTKAVLAAANVERV